MNNQEQKQKIWDTLKNKYSHLEDFCKIYATDLELDDTYFHPRFQINDDIYIGSQSDTTNKDLYAIRFHWITKNIHVDIHEGLLETIIIGYHTNKDFVELAMDTLNKTRKHINALNEYCDYYITNLLIGNGVEEVTNSIINELKANKKLISVMQTKLKK